MSRNPFGLTWKLTAATALVLVTAVAILSLLVLHGIRTDQTRQLEESLQHQSDTAALHVRQLYVTGTRLTPAAFMAQYGQELAVELGAAAGLPVVIYDTAGQEQGNSAPAGVRRIEEQALQHALAGQIAYVTDNDLVEYFSPVQGPNGLLGVIQLETSIKGQHDFYRYIQRLLLISGSSVTLLGLVLGYLFMTRQTAALRKLKEAAYSIRQNHFLSSPVLKRRDELGDLDGSIYEMSRTIESQIVSLEDEQSKLQLAVEKLQLLEQQQKQFIGNISHEFKTPVTSIRAYADLLQLYGDDVHLQQDAAKNITREAERLTDLIDRVIRLSQLESYDFENIPEEVDVKNALEEACSRLQGKLRQHQLQLHLNLESALICADRESLNHVFMNLLDNAIKYNEPGGLIRLNSFQANGYVQIMIQNTGSGIPLEYREKVFEPFFTVNPDRSRLSGGTGLGLPLVRQLVERQHGRIEVIDDPGGLTTFRISYPLWITDSGEKL
ncbi:HAMP domain-containing sensor histidine kinase [Paenibacillus sp. JX-17]|uniref:histidine kinase n=1 Tax=Paenibacillus lacisoli TaxID=3064525 RepID=A0ABT9CBW4_9BACL|nr:HAMP domain-containing sensor histidine kinase [Paenibacillus sp. JX-17]MDO7906749.1 HAMP domain-containing sensor histidine kinase [Paenibacillus sp. JX-17]